MALTISTKPTFKYVKNLLFAKEGIATIRPSAIENKIDTTDIKIVVVKPLNKNFRFVKPLTLLGDSINQSNSCFPHDKRNNNENSKNKFFTLMFIKN